MIRPQQISEQTVARNTPSVDHLAIFRHRAETLALIVHTSPGANKQAMVDGLWRYAEQNGLVKELGVDAVQAELARAFWAC